LKLPLEPSESCTVFALVLGVRLLFDSAATTGLNRVAPKAVLKASKIYETCF